jgi:hypothetical protein
MEKALPGNSGILTSALLMKIKQATNWAGSIKVPDV